MTVPVGDALWGALVRAVMRALMVVSSSSKVLFVASSEEHGVDVALISASARTPGRDEIVRGFDQLYAALGQARHTKAT